MFDFLFIIFVLLTLALITFWLHKRHKQKRRAKLFNQPFPGNYMHHILQNVPIYSRLPESLQQVLLGHIQVFLDEKAFFGFDGIEINDEIRVTIAANACLLLLGRQCDYFPGFSSIYIYPSTYIATAKSSDGLLQTSQQQTRHGESWFRGPIVLAWNASLHGSMDIKDGHNVILHEFAHKLDEEDGEVDGAPKLENRSRYISWARTMYPEYKRLQRKAKRGKKSVMDHYGATEPAEFFAVLVETFFEKPQQLQRKHPQLYDEVKAYFNLDPVSW